MAPYVLVPPSTDFEFPDPLERRFVNVMKETLLHYWEKYSPDNRILFDKPAVLPTMIFGASSVGENTETLNADPTRRNMLAGV